MALIALATTIAKSAPAAEPVTLPSTQPDSPGGATVANLRLTAAMEEKVTQVGDPVILDLTLANLTDQTRRVMPLHVEHEFVIAIRDSDGRTVPWTRLGRELQEGNPGDTGTSMGPLPPASAWRYRLRLDDLADLSEEDGYTVSVSIKLSKLLQSVPKELHDKTLESNQVDFIVRGKSIFVAEPTTPPATQPSFSHGVAVEDLRLTASMRETHLMSGEPVVLDVLVENVGKENRYFWYTAPENDFRIDLRDEANHAVPWTRWGEHIQAIPGVGGTSGPIEVLPKTAEHFHLRLDGLFDLTGEGQGSSAVANYSVVVRLKIENAPDPNEPLNPEAVVGFDLKAGVPATIESNQVQFTVHRIPVEWPETEPLADDGQGPATRPDALP
ncbi:MAG: hypothetical protein ABSH22_15460 [Tepidisphaeraceae bacterium]